MKKFAAIACTVLLGASAAAPAAAHGHGTDCSVASLVGRWVFATGVGRQMLGGPFPPEKDITAIGTLTVIPGGGVEGTFDVTVEDALFLPDITYSGSLVVNADCTGTLTFITSTGAVRTDSIVVVSSVELLGMSQDPTNLWTYQARRLPWRPGRIGPN